MQLSAWPNLHLQHPNLSFKSGYDKLPPHQEYNYSRGSLDSIVAWIPLFNQSAEHFPIELIKGSHKNGLLHHTLHGANTALDTLNPDQYDDSNFIRLKAHPGDAVLFSSFTIHRTGASRLTEIDSPVRVAANLQFNNLLEPSIIKRSYKIGNPTASTEELFDPNTFISTKNEHR
jgi:ectoine hydroxylase-related dioxygenase (phytanoyl-CoA dioxygenase family)